MSSRQLVEVLLEPDPKVMLSGFYRQPIPNTTLVELALHRFRQRPLVFNVFPKVRG